MATDGVSGWANIQPHVITQPAGGSFLNVVLGLALAATGFISATDTLVSTQFEVRTAPDGKGTLVFSTSGLLVPALTLSIGQTYYIRAHFTGSAGNASPWSADVAITT